MFKRDRKRKITVTLLIVLIAFMAYAIVATHSLRQKTRAASTAACNFLQSQSAGFKAPGPAKGEKLVKFGGSAFGFYSNAGGEGHLALRVWDASHESYDPTRKNVVRSHGGRVCYVVNLSVNPVVEIHHSNTLEARDMANEMLATLKPNYHVKIVSTSLQKNLTPSASRAATGTWIVEIAKYAQGIIAFSILGIAFIVVWKLAEYTTHKKLNAHGHHCTTCGYDLRGTPGDRCSECGTMI